MSDEYRIRTPRGAAVLLASETIFSGMGFSICGKSPTHLAMSRGDADPSTEALGGQILLEEEEGGLFLTLNLPGSPSLFAEEYQASLDASGIPTVVEEA